MSTEYIEVTFIRRDQWFSVTGKVKQQPEMALYIDDDVSMPQPQAKPLRASLQQLLNQLSLEELSDLCLWFYDDTAKLEQYPLSQEECCALVLLGLSLHNKMNPVLDKNNRFYFVSSSLSESELTLFTETLIGQMQVQAPSAEFVVECFILNACEATIEALQNLVRHGIKLTVLNQISDLPRLIKEPYAKCYYPVVNSHGQGNLPWIGVYVDETRQSGQILVENHKDNRKVVDILRYAREIDAVKAEHIPDIRVVFGGKSKEDSVSGDSYQLALVMADRIARGAEPPIPVNTKLICTGMARDGLPVNWKTGRVAPVEQLTSKIEQLEQYADKYCDVVLRVLISARHVTIPQSPKLTIVPLDRIAWWQ